LALQTGGANIAAILFGNQFCKSRKPYGHLLGGSIRRYPAISVKAEILLPLPVFQMPYFRARIVRIKIEVHGVFVENKLLFKARKVSCFAVLQGSPEPNSNMSKLRLLT
jgi:hypothetical protein